MGLRDRIAERHDDGDRHFRMQEKLLSIGDDSWIEDDHGDRVFKVNAKALRIRDTIAFEDASGTELLHIQEKKLRVRDTMEISAPSGETVATIKKAIISPIRERFSVDLADGTEWEIKGNIVDHEYEIKGPHGDVAEISKRWFRVRDTYGVKVESGNDVVLVLALTAAVDSITDRD
jgi:uncharacterized protein YxjI